MNNTGEEQCLEHFSANVRSCKVCVGLAAGLMMLASVAFAGSYTLSNTGTTSYQHVVQSGSAVESISNTYTVEVPAGLVALVTLVEYGNGFVTRNCETSTFHQRVGSVGRTLLTRTTEFLSTTTISLSMSCSPDVSWTEIPEVGKLNNGMPYYGHYVYHRYTDYYAKMNYLIVVSYEKLLPDLVVSSVSLSSSDAAVDETVALTYTVRNVGRKAAATTVVRIYDETKQICGDQTIPTLSVGASSTKAVTLPRLAAGRHTLKVVADASGVIDESHEGNNEATALLRDYERTPVAVSFEITGKADAKNRTVIAGDKIGTLPIPYRRGYVFSGWWTERTGGYQIDENEKITMGRTFYARWAARNCLIVFNQQGGKGASTVQATFDEYLPMVAIPVRQGHSFIGYWTGVDGTGTQYYAADGKSVRKWDHEAPEVVLYAKWKGTTDKLLLNAQGGSGGSASVTVTFERAMPSISIPTRQGWVFQGYFSSPGGEGVQYYASTGAGARIWDQVNESDVTLYAYWLPNQMNYSLTLDSAAGSGGSVSVLATYAADMPKITPPIRSRYVFEGYYTEPNGGGTQYYSANGESVRKWDLTPQNGVLYAKWSSAYRVRFSPNGATGKVKEQYFTEPEWRLEGNDFVCGGYVFAGWALEPNGVPVLPDGALVNKSFFGYGDDPKSEVVTLYAMWGRQLKTTLFSDVTFVTGGDGENPFWSERNGTLQSAAYANTSWLSAVFAERGELNYALSNAIPGAGNCACVFAANDRVYTNVCDEISSLTVSIPSGRRIATWVCNKSLALNDWGAVGPTVDSTKVSYLWTNKTNALENTIQEICRYVKPLLEEELAHGYSISWEEVEEGVRSACNLYYEHKISDIVETLPHRFSSYSTASLKRALNNGTAAGRAIKSLCSTAENMLNDKCAIEQFVGDVGVLREMSFAASRLVGFVLNDGSSYQQAIVASDRIVDKKLALEEIIQEICRYVKPLLEEELAHGYSISWEEVEEGVRSACNLYYEHKISDIVETLPHRFSSYSTASLKRALNNGTAAGRAIKSLCSTAENMLNDVDTLERRIRACCVQHWALVCSGACVGELPEPEKIDGYAFTGWWTTATGGGRIEPTAVINVDSVFYAHWQKETHSLSFITGTNVKESRRTLDYDKRIGELPTPVRAGYTFDGWSYQGSGESASILDFLDLDVMLVAQWTKDTDWTWDSITPPTLELAYQLVFDASVGVGVMEPRTLEFGCVYKLPANAFLPPSGKRFAGWACSNGRRYDDGMLVFDLAKPGETVTMTAIWE